MMNDRFRYTLQGAAAGTACLMLLGLGGCGPTAESILKKYESYGTVEPVFNRSGASVTEVEKADGDGSRFFLTLGYADPLLDHVEEYVETLAGRWCVADAEDPSESLPFEVALSVDSLDGNAFGLPAYHTVISIDGKDCKSRFVLLGFKGIGNEESEALETPSLFYILELKNEIPQLVGGDPFAGSQIFTPDFPKTGFSADAIRIQQLLGSWGRTGGSFKTDPNGVMTFSPALTFTVDSAYQEKPSLVFGKERVFTSDIDYAGHEDDFVRFFKYAKSLRLGQNNTWACENFVEGPQGEEGYIFSCDLKLTPVSDAFDYKLTLVENNVIRLDVFEKVYLPEAPDHNTGFVMKGGIVPIHSSFNFKRL